MSELKPCPFCGAEAHGYEIEAHQHSPALLALCPGLPPEPEGRYVIEGRCACGSGLIGDSQEEVTERWNRRAQPAQAGQDFTEQLREVARRAGTPTDHTCDCGRKWKHTTYGWASTEPAQAGQVLTDDEVALIVAECAASAHRQDDFSFARAIEQAVLAKRVPMTPEETDAAMKLLFYPARNRAFIDGIKAAERHHGIVGEKGGAT